MPHERDRRDRHDQWKKLRDAAQHPEREPPDIGRKRVPPRQRLVVDLER
jgi:hypothetical protein